MSEPETLFAIERELAAAGWDEFSFEDERLLTLAFHQQTPL